MYLAAAWLKTEQHDRRVTVLAAPVAQFKRKQAF